MTDEIIAYDTVTSCNEEVFRKFINRHIKDGWQPLGGMSICIDSEDSTETYAQAMVKYKEVTNV